MQVFVINLDSAAERMAFQTAQAARLGLTLTHVPACTVADLARDPRPARWWDGWERPLRDVEKACLLSHRRVWDRIASGTAPALVLEDDALLSDQVPAFLSAMSARDGIEHLSLETRGRKKLLGPATESGVPGIALRRLILDRSGAAAYILWPAGAARLVARTDRAPALADAAICAAFDMARYQSDPPLAIQIDMCDRYDIPAPIETRSTILPAGGHGTDQRRATAAQKLRRLRAQSAMGWQQLVHATGAERVEIRPEPKQFNIE
ncbi:glycosyltransferase family 25 protein [Oceanomicrobium pacificus]|uniref:Glycosyl transferase family 25 n=1 Tax=Oceanomicrobium pacificus TaxID=2692916 RepID=A0A6B0TQM2_9RHOB|nr:glycosyltransferase family 25 protein [Oceanomicrobium pacificus]MXU64085.1 glycosyl transferase family 25 [Oceanomicrobium pacificus]